MSETRRPSPHTTEAAWTTSERDRVDRTVSSALWAAWADALGFISELTDEAGLARRLRGEQLKDPVDWSRRVGGKYGVVVNLPAGCYSDDTQLRLSTGRAISNHGFDVEAFARIELTTWPSYALGGGRASRAAATGLSKANASWFANFVDGWQDAGGNGVAMRTQPHVWAAKDLSGDDLLENVLINGVTSHGHPRALVGAVLHAAALALALRDRRVPGQSDWPDLLGVASDAVHLFDSHELLANIWRPNWERVAEMPFDKAWHATVGECEDLLSRCAGPVNDLADCGSDVGGATARDSYLRLATALGLADEKTRGSGTSTVVAALGLAAGMPNHPADGARLAAGAVGTDTDTIATMAAALVGAGSAAAEPESLLDQEYLRCEAERLSRIGLGRQADMFPYPDLLRWSPPRSQLECVGLADSTPALAGLGWLEALAPPIEGRNAVWQWMRTSFGATVLIKQRPQLKNLPKGNWPRRRVRSAPTPSTHDTGQQMFVDMPSAVGEDSAILRKTGGVAMTTQIQPDQTRPNDARTAALHSSAKDPRSAPSPAETAINVDQILEWVARRQYDDGAIGYAVTRLSEIGSVEQLVAFTMAVRAAISVRAQRSREPH